MWDFINLKQRAKQLKTDIPALFLALSDLQTPILAKVLAGITLCYALSPLDLIPDFIPVLGYLDDVLLLPCLILLTVRLIPAPVWERCRQSAQGLWAEGWPKQWYFALPVELLWALVLIWAASRLWAH